MNVGRIRCETKHSHACISISKGIKFSQQYLLEVRVVGVIRVWDCMGHDIMPRLTIHIPSCFVVFSLYDMSAELP